MCTYNTILVSLHTDHFEIQKKRFRRKSIVNLFPRKIKLLTIRQLAKNKIKVLFEVRLVWQIASKWSDLYDISTLRCLTCLKDLTR